MKKLKPILIVIVVITVISIIAVLLIRQNAKRNILRSEGQTKFDKEENLNALPPEIAAQLRTSCSILTSRASVERVYRIKCSDYGL